MGIPVATEHQREIGSVGRAAFEACRREPTSKGVRSCAGKFTRTYWKKREHGATRSSALKAAKNAVH